MATLANQNGSRYATPFSGVAMPRRPQGSFVSGRTLAEEPNFSGQSQQWHVIGSDGVTVRRKKGKEKEKEKEGRRGEGRGVDGELGERGES